MKTKQKSFSLYFKTTNILKQNSYAAWKMNKKKNTNSWEESVCVTECQSEKCQKWKFIYLVFRFLFIYENTKQLHEYGNVDWTNKKKTETKQKIYVIYSFKCINVVVDDDDANAADAVGTNFFLKKSVLPVNIVTFTP